MSADVEFLRGVTAALAVLEVSGEGCSTLYEEIVGTVGGAKLIRQARRDGAMRWSGLGKYTRSDHWKRASVAPPEGGR